MKRLDELDSEQLAMVKKLVVVGLVVLVVASAYFLLIRGWLLTPTPQTIGSSDPPSYTINYSNGSNASFNIPLEEPQQPVLAAVCGDGQVSVVVPCADPTSLLQCFECVNRSNASVSVKFT